MGYARLIYPISGSVLVSTVLHDIVGCVTGQFSSSAQLRGTLIGSEIVNTLGQNWTIAHPSGSFVPTTPNSSLGSWVLTAPCVDSSKTKYVRLHNIYRGINSVTVANTGSGTSNTYKIGTATNTVDGATGVFMQACVSASNATTPISGSWYSTNIGASDFDRVSVMNGSEIIVSWSSRHILLWSNAVASISPNNEFLVVGYLEFPENAVTVARNIIPAYLIIERNGNLSQFISSYGPAVALSTNWGDILAPQFFNVASSTQISASLSTQFTTFDLLSSYWTVVKPTSTIPTIDEFGNNTRMMMPLVVNMLSKGQPSVNLSTYSNVYMVANNMGRGGNILSGSSGQYVYLPGLSISFAVRRE